MANVTDPNPWPTLPLADSQGQSPKTPPPARAETWLINEGNREEQELEAVELSMALRHLFDSGRDRVVWNLSPAQFASSSSGEQYVRFDAQHGSELAVARAIGAGDIDSPGHDGTKPWMIVVDNVRDLADADRIDRLRSALQPMSRLLLVGCEEDDVDVENRGETAARRAEELSRRLRFDYVGPIAGQDSRRLVDALAKIKAAGQPTFLHVRTRNPARAMPDPHVKGPWTPGAAVETAPRVDTLRHVASRALAELAADNDRIVAISTSDHPDLVRPWTSIPNRMFPVDDNVAYALQWCASLAAGGSRPFAFLSLEEVQNHFGRIRREICLDRAGVTLIVEPRADASTGGPASSAALAGLRQLPHVSLMSPKDPAELRHMLAWCASQPDPAVIWLPQAAIPQATWTTETAIRQGQAEQLSEGQDVALVAFGPMVAAAQTAADSLARYGIAASVVNARFAQPLDIETIARAARAALTVVLVDDVEGQGGFAGWVLELLLQAGITQPVSIVAPSESARLLDPHNLQKECALRIVDSCRWLSAPVTPSATVESVLPSATGDEYKAVAGNWLNLFGRPADSMAREREQVYARQLSSDVQRWVAIYEKIGSRDLYLWKWCLHGVELTTLPGVVPEFRAHVCDTKVLSIVLCVLLDDVADQHGESRLLDALLEMTCLGASRSPQGLNAVEQRHADATRALWEEYWTRAANYPCFDNFEPVLRYDLVQFFNTMRYSHLVNSRPYMLNMVEHDLYTSHNMMMVSFAMLDLMCSPGFPKSEVGPLREMAWHAQCMGRIGNLLSTWRRELIDRDFTSGVFARAMMEGDLTLDELEHADASSLEATIRGRGHESYFFRKWLEHRERCHACARRVRSLDLRSVLEGHDRFFAMHLGSQGLI